MDLIHQIRHSRDCIRNGLKTIGGRMKKQTSIEMGTEYGARQETGLDLSEEVPSVTYKTVTFSDGTQISLNPTDIVVFVGPNNAGKSLALKELEDSFDGVPINAKVVSEARSNKTGTKQDFAKFVKRYTQVSIQGSNEVYMGRRGLIWPLSEKLEERWPDHIKTFGPLFCMRIPSETRISDSDPVDAIDIEEEPLEHPIHMLYSDDELELKISAYFRRAFGQDLILDRGAGRAWPLRVGTRLRPYDGEMPFSTSFLSRQRRSTLPLDQQGDGMRSFASVVLHLLAPASPSILLLDEPEAFLHPPQARLLGEIIASQKSPSAQLFLATHSPDVLQGLVNAVPEHLRILRMQRDGNVNRIKELDKELIKKISYDPIMRYSSVLSGLFHERVIICESDADCMFYSSILDLPEVHGETHPDVLFVHASGKDRMATLAKTLVALDVPVDIVADIDLLNDEHVLKSTIEALDGDWDLVKPRSEAVRKAIEEHKPLLNAIEVKKGIEEILQRTPASGEFPKRLRSEINKLFRKASPWDAIKEGGETVIPSGEATKKYLELQNLCGQVGLWIVPVGELEGFCKSVGGHGPRWVQQVIEGRNLATDSELESARKFVKQLWESKRFYASVDTAQVTDS